MSGLQGLYSQIIENRLTPEQNERLRRYLSGEDFVAA